MSDRRNPYFILGLDYGASPKQAQAAFARLSRRLRRETDAPYRMEDATWALHEIEHATAQDSDLNVYRVPANPDAYTYQPEGGVFAPAPQNLPRRTGSSAEEVTRLQAEVADQLGADALAAAVEDWENPARETAATTAEPSRAAEVPTVVSAPSDVVTAAGPGHRHDPLAVVLGNATLLGVGYLLLRRWGVAAATVATTAVLLSFVGAFGQPGWFWRVAVLLWWVFTVVHGWRLAVAHRWRSRPQRAVAAGTVAVVALGLVGFAVDGRRVEAAAADAHAAGDCEEATAALDRIGSRHRIVDPFVTDRTGGDAEACELLLAAQAEDDPAEAAALLAQYVDHRTGRWGGAPELRFDLLLAAAERELEASLDGDRASLAAGFDLLAELLAQAPARAEAVSESLTGYVAQLADADPCDVLPNFDWLNDRERSGDELDLASDDAERIAPPALAACGDQLLDHDPPDALQVYETLLDRYPDHELAGAAREGVDAAETLIEEEQLRGLLTGSSPRYCENPAPYRGAAPYNGAGPHPVLVFGSDRFADAISSDWLAEDHTDVSLVLCVDGPSDGDVLETCQYEADTVLGVHTVQLRANEYSVEAYEVHTGEVAFDTTVQVGSGGCPPILEWTCRGVLPNCPPPSSIRASHSDGPIRAAVQSWVFP